MGGVGGGVVGVAPAQRPGAPSLAAPGPTPPRSCPPPPPPFQPCQIPCPVRRNKETGELVAVKLIKRPLPKIILPNILREIQIQADLGEGHVNVIEAKEALLTESHLALVMEYAAGGSLTGYVAERWQHAQANGLFLSEAEARYFFRQFIEAVSYCHANCVAHRDLKLDNTLLDGGSPPIIKLCDFGFAKTWTEDANMFTHIGGRRLAGWGGWRDGRGGPRTAATPSCLPPHHPTPPSTPPMPPLSPSGTPVYMSPELINSNRASDKGRAGTRAGWRAGGGACARAQAGARTAVWARAPPVPATVKPTAVVTHATHTPLNHPQPPPPTPLPPIFQVRRRAGRCVGIGHPAHRHAAGDLPL